MPHKKSLNQCPFLVFCTSADHIGLEACKALMQAYYAFLNRFCCPKCGYSYTMTYPLFWAAHGHHAGYFRSAKALVENNVFQHPQAPVQPVQPMVLAVQRVVAQTIEVPAVQRVLVQAVPVQYAVVEEVPTVQAETYEVQVQLPVLYAEVLCWPS